jgi:hypothetical protein
MRWSQNPRLVEKSGHEVESEDDARKPKMLRRYAGATMMHLQRDSLRRARRSRSFGEPNWRKPPSGTLSKYIVEIFRLLIPVGFERECVQGVHEAQERRHETKVSVWPRKKHERKPRRPKEGKPKQKSATAEYKRRTQLNKPRSTAVGLSRIPMMSWV